MSGEKNMKQETRDKRKEVNKFVSCGSRDGRTSSEVFTWISIEITELIKFNESRSEKFYISFIFHKTKRKRLNQLFTSLPISETSRAM